jgi:flagellar biosynthetic protein FlhB
MAEGGEDSSQDKSEEPTAKRIEKSKEEGQVPRSKELNTTVLLMVGSGGLLMYGGELGNSMKKIMLSSFSIPREVIFDTNQMGLYFANAAIEASTVLMPLLFALFFSSILGSIALGGWLLSAKAMAPKFSRMSILKGLKRMFALKALVELLKAIAKVSVVLFFAVLILDSRTEELLGLSQESILLAMEHAVQILGWSFFYLSCTMIVIAMADVPFQIYDHHKNLKMTKQEVKDEYKDTEGKPEVKGRVRQLQREIAQRRMMADVPEADVVITNPTHYAVALRYNPEKDAAPILLAKGNDQTALKIREIAKVHGIEIVSAPPLARSVYHHSEIGQEIPSGLYMAVAQILAYIFQLKQFRRRVANRPDVPDFPIPDDLRSDE